MLDLGGCDVCAVGFAAWRIQIDCRHMAAQKTQRDGCAAMWTDEGL